MTPATIITTDRTLDELEAVVRRGLDTFVEVGKALAEIHNRKLYREVGFATFEDYAEKQFNLKRRSAYEYMAASEAAENVRTFAQTPPTKSQAVELAKLSPEKQVEVAKVLNFKVTPVREVKKIVAEELPEKKRKPSWQWKTRFDVNRCVGNTAQMAAGFASSFETVESMTEQHIDDIDRSQVSQWIRDIDEGIEAMSKYRSMLAKIAENYTKGDA